MGEFSAGERHRYEHHANPNHEKRCEKYGSERGTKAHGSKYRMRVVGRVLRFYACVRYWYECLRHFGRVR